MSTSRFTFLFANDEGYDEGADPRAVATQAETGREVVRTLDTTARFVAEGTIILDGSSGNAYSDWESFWRSTTSYGATTILFKAQRAAHSKVSGEALGTASGGGGETFTLDKKFIHHTDFGESATTLVVKVNGVAQTLTTDYTVSLNGTTPTITTTANFDTGSVTADYDYYHQGRVNIDRPRTQVLNDDTSLASQGAHKVAVTFREAVPGGHLA